MNSGTESFSPPVAAAESLPVATIEPQTLSPEPAFLTEQDNQEIALLENAPRATTNDIETALATYAGTGTELTASPPVEEIPEASYTIEDNPETATTEPEIPVIPIEQQSAELTPDQIKQQIDDEVKRQGGSSTKAYDQLVYAYPDRAEELAAAGNKDAAAALARRDALVNAPQTSTSLENRQSKETDVPQLEVSQVAREAQAQVAELIQEVEEDNSLPPKLKKMMKMISNLSIVLLYLSLQSTAKLSIVQVSALGEVARNLKPRERKKGEAVVKQIEEKLEESQPQLETAPQERQLMLPAPDQPATALPEPLMQQALLLPPPAEDFSGPVLSLSDASVPVAAPTS